jgi:membrane dipeptidase
MDMLSVMTLDFGKQDKWMANPELFTAADFQPFRDSGINVIHPAIGMGGFNSLRQRFEVLCILERLSRRPG